MTMKSNVVGLTLSKMQTRVHIVVRWIEQPEQKQNEVSETMTAVNRLNVSTSARLVGVSRVVSLMVYSFDGSIQSSITSALERFRLL